jgi:mRNA interferase MazF
MPSTTIYRHGHVIVVEVPFSDLTGTKRRPALVVSADRFHQTLADIIVCPISSQPRFYRRPGPGDCPLESWRRVGLRHPSTVRVSKLLAIDKRIVKKSLGKLPPDDVTKVASVIRQAFGLSGSQGPGEVPSRTVHEKRRGGDHDRPVD